MDSFLWLVHDGFRRLLPCCSLVTVERSFWRHGGNTVVFCVIGDSHTSLRPFDFLVATKIHLLDQGSFTGTYIGEIKHVW